MKVEEYIKKIDKLVDKYSRPITKDELDELKYEAEALDRKIKHGNYWGALWYASQMGATCNDLRPEKMGLLRKDWLQICFEGLDDLLEQGASELHEM